VFAVAAGPAADPLAEVESPAARVHVR